MEKRKCGNDVTVKETTNHECLLYSTIPISKAAYFQMPNRFAHLIESHSKYSLFSTVNEGEPKNEIFREKLQKPVLRTVRHVYILYLYTYTTSFIIWA